MKIFKGEIGYIKQQRNGYLIKTIIGYLAAIVVFVVGIMMFDTKANSLTIIAVLAFLPVSLWAVRLLVFIKHGNKSEENYEELNKLFVNRNEEVLFDLLLTNESSIYSLPVCVIVNNELYVYMNNKKYKCEKVRDFLDNIFDKNNIKTKVTVYDSFSEFIEKVKPNKNINKNNDEIKRILLIHCM